MCGTSEAGSMPLERLLGQQASSRPDDSRDMLATVLKLSIGQLDDHVATACLKSSTVHSKKNGEVVMADLIESWIGEELIFVHAEGDRVISKLLERQLLELSEDGEFVKCLDLDRSGPLRFHIPAQRTFRILDAGCSRAGEAT